MEYPKMHVFNFCQADIPGSQLRHCDLTVSIVEAMSDDERRDLAESCIAGFIYGGDPTTWEGFDSISLEAQMILTSHYRNWRAADCPGLAEYLGFSSRTKLH